jgi:hypothetical protein
LTGSDRGLPEGHDLLIGWPLRVLLQDRKLGLLQDLRQLEAVRIAQLAPVGTLPFESVSTIDELAGITDPTFTEECSCVFADTASDWKIGQAALIRTRDGTGELTGRF